MPKQWVAALVLFVGLTMNGCTTLFEVDLAAQRAENLKTDIAFLRSAETMTFSEPLSVEDAISIGLENNLELRISRLMEEIADDAALAERLKMLPSLEANLRQQRRNNFSITEYIDPVTGEPTISSSINQEKTSKTFSLELSWSILDFGLSYIRARQAAFSKEVRRMERIRQAQTLASEIAVAYYRSLLAEKNLQYIQRIEQNVLQFKEKAELLVAQKRLDPIVAREMEKQWASLSIAANDLQAQISGMRIELCKLMGLTPMTRFELSDMTFAEQIDELPDPMQLDPKELELLSLKNRPELYAADMEYHQQQDEARVALVSMFPTVSFDMGYYYNANKFLFNNDWYVIGAEMATGLLALPSRYADWKAKKKGVTMAQFQRLMLSAGIVAQVHMALHDYRVKKERFELKDHSYGISEDLLSMSRERNEAGSRGFSDVSVTERMLSTLVEKLGRDQSLIELLNAYNTLLVTLGLGYEGWEEDLLELDQEMELRDLPDDWVSSDKGAGIDEGAYDQQLQRSPLMSGWN